MQSCHVLQSTVLVLPALPAATGVMMCHEHCHYVQRTALLLSLAAVAAAPGMQQQAAAPPMSSLHTAAAALLLHQAAAAAAAAWLGLQHSHCQLVQSLASLLLLLLLDAYQRCVTAQ
jgi:hypothetical protein